MSPPRDQMPHHMVLRESGCKSSPATFSAKNDGKRERSPDGLILMGDLPEERTL